jgi:hypothetical protein
MSLRAAIDAHCRSCIHDPRCGGGTWREQVAQCSAVNCALWPVRAAPGSGPFADPPRDPATVTQEWLRAPTGKAVSALLPADRPRAASDIGVRQPVPV